MGGAASRRKGHDFERWVAKELRALWPMARRGLQYQDGNCPPDVVGTPYHIECKKGIRTDIKAAMYQADRDAAEHAIGLATPRPSVAITKDDNGPVLVTMRFADWVALQWAALPDPMPEPVRLIGEKAK